MTPCSWCALEFPSKPGKHFCCAAHRQAFHAACRAYTHDMLAQGFVTRETLRKLYGAYTLAEAIDMRGRMGG